MKKILYIFIVLHFSVMLYAQQKFNYTESRDGSYIAYKILKKNSDKTLVFIHGWSCDSRYWYKQEEFFQDKYSMILIDLAGHGNSSADREKYTVKKFAEDVAAVLAAEDINNAVLLGHSMGGAIIANTALIAPDRVKALIGVDTFHDVGRKISSEEYDEMVNPLEADFNNNTKNFVGSMFRDNSDMNIRNWVINDMGSAAKKAALSSFKEYLSLYLADEAINLFKNIKIPVFAVNADLWPTNVEENKKLINSFDAVIIKDSGHFLMLDNSMEFNNKLKAVLERI